MTKLSSLPFNWDDATMSIMREKRANANEDWLLSQSQINLFDDNASDLDAQSLFMCSYEYKSAKDMRLVTLNELRQTVLSRLPSELLFLGDLEHKLLEQLIFEGGELPLLASDHHNAAKSLVKRLYCNSFQFARFTVLQLPEQLHQPIMEVFQSETFKKTRNHLRHCDMMIRSLLYISGTLSEVLATQCFINEFINETPNYAYELVHRYLCSSFDHIYEASGELLLLHPAVADPMELTRLREPLKGSSITLTDEMLTNAANGIFDYEIPLHRSLSASLNGALRSEFRSESTAEDLRLLIKQGVQLETLKDILSNMLLVAPTPNINGALQQLYDNTPRWLGVRNERVQ